MATWLEDITSALIKVGGIAHYEQLYAEINRAREGVLPESWKQIVQRTIQNHSSDSSGYRSRDLFYSVEGIGSGIWGLRSALIPTPYAFDLQEPSPPERVLTETYRVLRDTQLARKLKALHRNACQICSTTLRLADGTMYSEAHHIRPLGAPHNGPDVAGNIIVLCPNHHVLFDYGALSLDADKLSIVHGHRIEAKYVAYHNEIIAATVRSQI
jgi:hypothetical protein